MPHDRRGAAARVLGWSGTSWSWLQWWSSAALPIPEMSFWSTLLGAILLSVALVLCAFHNTSQDAVAAEREAMGSQAAKKISRFSYIVWLVTLLVLTTTYSDLASRQR